MELRRDEFPIALQAYEVRADRENFVAEQVVNSQLEADNFMSMYAGRLIKTREVRPVEIKKIVAVRAAARRRAAIPAWIIVLAILIILFVVAYAEGWLQTLMQQVK